MMVIFLVGLVSMILMRTLRKDYARYSKVSCTSVIVFFQLHSGGGAWWSRTRFGGRIRVETDPRWCFSTCNAANVLLFADRNWGTGIFCFSNYYLMNSRRFAPPWQLLSFLSLWDICIQERLNLELVASSQRNLSQPKKEHGEMVTTGLFTYAVLSPINGYIGGGLYSRMGGETWIKVEISNF